MDLSLLSDEDLIAYDSGDIENVSDDGLRILSGQKPLHKFEIRNKAGDEPLELQPELAPENPVPYTSEWTDRVANDTVRALVGLTDIINNPRYLMAQISDSIMGRDPQFPDSTSYHVKKDIDNLNKLATDAQKSQGDTGVDLIRMGTKLGVETVGIGKLLMAKSLIGKGLEGLGIGGYIGATEYKPKEGERYSLKEAGEQAATTAAVGAVAAPAVDAAVKTAGAVKHFAKHLTIGDPGTIAVRAAGDKAPKVIKALRTHKSKVPGVKYTAGQAASKSGSPQFSALQKHVEKEAPEILGSVGVKGKQEAARRFVIDKIGKTPKTLRVAQKTRADATRKLYRKSYEAGVKGNRNAEDVKHIVENPFFKDAEKAASKVAEAEGITFESNATRYMHHVKTSLDKMLRKTGDDALDVSQKRAVLNLKGEVLEWQKKTNPLYEQARLKYAELSEPINRIEIGQMFQSALKESVGSGERIKAFARIVNKVSSDINPHTGKPLINSLTKKQIDSVRDIIDDLHRNVNLKTQASEGMKSMLERVGAAELPPTGLFKPALSAARSWFNRISGRLTRKGTIELGKLMKDPKKLADAMENAGLKEQEVIGMMLQKILIPPVVIGSTEIKDK